MLFHFFGDTEKKIRKFTDKSFSFVFCTFLRIVSCELADLEKCVLIFILKACRSLNRVAFLK